MKKLWALRYVITMLGVICLGIILFRYAAAHYMPYLKLGIAALLALVLFQYIRRKIRESRRGWRVRNVGWGQWVYEEKLGTDWVGVHFEELGDPREPTHLLGIPSVESWGRLPSWAFGRRDEILVRLKSELTGFILKDA